VSAHCSNQRQRRSVIPFSSSRTALVTWSIGTGGRWWGAQWLSVSTPCRIITIGATFMTVRQPRYRKEEFARRGDEIYDRDIRPLVEAEHKGKFVAIDIETGQWEMDVSEMTACDRLLARIPEAQTWLARVGFRAARRFGPRLRPTS